MGLLSIQSPMPWDMGYESISQFHGKMALRRYAKTPIRSHALPFAIFARPGLSRVVQAVPSSQHVSHAYILYIA